MLINRKQNSASNQNHKLTVTEGPHNIKKPENMFIFCQIIIKLSAYFNRAISGKIRDQVQTNLKIEKIRSRTVNIIFRFHHMTKTAACFTLTLGELGLSPEARIYLV